MKVLCWIKKVLTMLNGVNSKMNYINARTNLASLFIECTSSQPRFSVINFGGNPILGSLMIQLCSNQFFCCCFQASAHFWPKTWINLQDKLHVQSVPFGSIRHKQPVTVRSTRTRLRDTTVYNVFINVFQLICLKLICTLPCIHISFQRQWKIFRKEPKQNLLTAMAWSNP